MAGGLRPQHDEECCIEGNWGPHPDCPGHYGWKADGCGGLVLDWADPTDQAVADEFRERAEALASREPLPADVLTGDEQLSLPPGCRCGYARSLADGLWHVISRARCPLHDIKERG